MHLFFVMSDCTKCSEFLCKHRSFSHTKWRIMSDYRRHKPLWKHTHLPKKSLNAQQETHMRGCDWITGVASGPMTSQHLKCWFSVSESQSVWSEWFGLIPSRSVSHECVHTHQHPNAREHDSVYWVSSDALRHTRLWWWKNSPIDET